MTYDDVKKYHPTVPEDQILIYLDLTMHTWGSSISNKHLDVVYSGLRARDITIEEESEWREIWRCIEKQALNERKKEAIKTVGSNYDC